MRGIGLTIRENNLFVQTVADLIRVLHFAVSVVPFLKFALAIYIKIFPDMLPTTFQTKYDYVAKLIEYLKVILEIVKILQKTLDNMSVSGKEHTCVSAKEFAEFSAKVRQKGVVISADEMLKFSILLKDKITLCSLPRRLQLVALCRMVELLPIGTLNFRFQLTLKLGPLAIDFKMIQKEDIYSLILSELKQACKSCGISYDHTEERLKQHLTRWLELSLNVKVPPDSVGKSTEAYLG